MSLGLTERESGLLVVSADEQPTMQVKVEKQQIGSFEVQDPNDRKAVSALLSKLWDAAKLYKTPRFLPEDRRRRDAQATAWQAFANAMLGEDSPACEEQT